MKSLSIHGIDPRTENAIKQRAKSESKSVNKVVKELIAKSLGLDIRAQAEDKRALLAHLCGVWTEEEADQFLASIDEFEVVDPQEWR